MAKKHKKHKKNKEPVIYIEPSSKIQYLSPSCHSEVDSLIAGIFVIVVGLPIFLLVVKLWFHLIVFIWRF